MAKNSPTWFTQGMASSDYDNFIMMDKGFPTYNIIEGIEKMTQPTNKDILLYIDYFTELYGNGLIDSDEIKMVNRLLKQKIERTSWQVQDKDTAKIIIELS